IGEPLRVIVNTISRRGGGSAAAAQAALTRSHNKLRIVSFNSHHPILDDELVLEEPARRARIDHMLLLEHARGERAGTLAGTHRHSGLDDDRSPVELACHEMHGATVQ